MAANAIGIDRSATLTTATDEVQTMIMIQDNSVIGISSLLVIDQGLTLYTALDSFDINLVLDEYVQYKDLIRCLIQCESSYNPNATGDNGKAFGILQFWRTTFDQYSKKYELDLSYENPVHQIILCDKMLTEDFNNTSHWKNCSNICLKTNMLKIYQSEQDENLDEEKTETEEEKDDNKEETENEKDENIDKDETEEDVTGIE